MVGFADRGDHNGRGYDKYERAGLPGVRAGGELDVGGAAVSVDHIGEHNSDSAAVAAAAIGRLCHHLAEKILVSLPGGELIVSWPNTQGSLFLTGPASFVYEGTLFV